MTTSLPLLEVQKNPPQCIVEDKSPMSNTSDNPGPSSVKDIETNELVRILLVRFMDENEVKKVPSIKLYKLWRLLQPYIIDIHHHKGPKQ